MHNVRRSYRNSDNSSLMMHVRQWHCHGFGHTHAAEAGKVKTVFGDESIVVSERR